jgi:hypothetical protein
MLQRAVADMQPVLQIDPGFGVKVAIMGHAGAQSNDHLGLGGGSGSQQAGGQERPKKRKIANFHPDSPEKKFPLHITPFWAVRALFE